MNKGSALDILLSEREAVAPTIPESLVRDVLSIEERVQFDEERKEAPQKINSIVQASLDREFMEEPGNGDAPE